MTPEDWALIGYLLAVGAAAYLVTVHWLNR